MEVWEAARIELTGSQTAATDWSFWHHFAPDITKCALVRALQNGFDGGSVSGSRQLLSGLDPDLEFEVSETCDLGTQLAWRYHFLYSARLHLPHASASVRCKLGDVC
jgi:hypothetical protein